MKALIIGDRKTAIAFKMLGFETAIVSSSKEMLDHVKKTVEERTDIGLILLTNNFVREILDDINRIRQKHPLPVMVIIPSCEKEVDMKYDYRSLVKEALGIKI